MTAPGRHILAGILGGLLAFGALVAMSTSINDGSFEYALDDAYIHLAMAEQIFAGGYGVNAGEFASAASSPLYPLLLPTWAGMTVQSWLPLAWNVLFAAMASGFLGWAIGQTAIPKLGIFFAAIAPAALAIPVVAATGMENLAHGAASLAILLGLWAFAETGRIGWLLPIGVFLAPAFRLEGVALALAAGGVVFLLGRPGNGVLLALLALLPVAVFVGTLSWLGLDPLPNSVNAKLLGQNVEDPGRLVRLGTTFNANIGQYGGRYVFILMAVVGLLAVIVSRQGARNQALVALAVVAATVAHLAVASVGWMDRYENYLVLTLVATLALLLAHAGTTVRAGVLGLALIGGALTYGPHATGHMHNPHAIAKQHAQMARFVKDHVRAPVAVNDLGYVAWNNPNYVLDLWGLASAQALAARKSDPGVGWADPLADARNVRVALIYDDWLPDALGPNWVPLGTLYLITGGLPFLGSVAVAFYARSSADAEALQPAIVAWSAELPDGAVFVLPNGEVRP